MRKYVLPWFRYRREGDVWIAPRDDPGLPQRIRDEDVTRHHTVLTARMAAAMGMRAFRVWTQKTKAREQPMTLHMLALPHTISTPAWSHCAYTGKVLRFGKMMAPFGYKVVHYGVEGAEVEGAEHVTVLDAPTFWKHRGPYDPNAPTGSGFVYDPQIHGIGTPLALAFNRGVLQELLPRVAPGDAVCLPFGKTHKVVTDVLAADITVIETGVGYEDPFSRFQVFETYAWMAWVQGFRQQRRGDFYQWVAHNYFDASEWTVQPRPSNGYVLYFGRIIESKGLRTIYDIAQARPDLKFVLCGQGDKDLGGINKLPNIEIRAPVFGLQRDALFAGASVVLMPTDYIEPFGGVCVEAQLSGRPVVATDWGAFPEILAHGVAGYRCHTLGDFLRALDLAPLLDPHTIRKQAEEKFSLAAVGARYHSIFQQCRDLVLGGGWADRTPRWVSIP